MFVQTRDLLGHGFLREDGAYNYMFMFRKKVESQFGTPLPTDVDSVRETNLQRIDIIITKFWTRIFYFCTFWTFDFATAWSHPLHIETNQVLKIAEELDPVLRQACGVSSILIEPKN